jgi:hypothetical protein
MDLENLETIRLSSTIHPQQRLQIEGPSSRPDVKHALVVVNRMLRSRAAENDTVRERIVRAAGILQAAEPTQTAFVSGRPVDVAVRIATRLIRRLGF